MLFILFASLSKAEIPLGVFPNCSEETQEQCPDDLREKWYLIDWVPEVAKESVREVERSYGSGNGVNPAWAYSTGRFDVTVGIMDSGIKWDKGDLRYKYFLNRAELPLPQLDDGTEAEDYDANGDGIFNLRDYEDDPRVQEDSGITGDNDKLDVSDLLYTFSDGIDDDGNGFIDDISGWDFFEQDNDAFHTLTRGYGTHGEGVARSAAAEGGDGGDIGVCPNCSILPLRVSDTFVADGGRTAEAIAYGSDMGAVSITMAVGALSNSRSTEEAAQYAYNNGTLLVGAAGDENAYHHNFPALMNNIVFVHSLSHNTGDDNAMVYSYMNTWNCNNFGARLDIVAAEAACATGAVAQTVGAVGLLQSAAKDQNMSLLPGEIYQILIQTVTDVNLTEEERSTAKAYPSHEGWDAFYGYGRLHVGRAVEMVINQDIPPAISVNEPEWFQTFDPTQQDTVSINVQSTARTSEINWRMEYGLGNDPQEWIALSSGENSATVGEKMDFSAELQLSEIPPVVLEEADFDEDILERLERVNTPSVTVRVFVTDADGRESVMRKTFFVHRDSGLKKGFPIRMDGSGEGAPVVYDVTGDGVMEIVIGDSSGYVHIFDGSGAEIEGWPVQTQLKSGIDPNANAFEDVTPTQDAVSASPAVGDITGDGNLNVVALGFDGGIYAWNLDGSLVDGFPQQSIGRDVSELTEYHTFDQGFLGAPTLYDLDDDGALEIIASGLDARLYVLTGSGENYPNYPIELCYPDECETLRSRSINSPSVGDIDGDGKPEIAVATNEAVMNETRSVSYLIDALTGEYEEGWPLAVRGLVGEAVLLPLIGEGHPASLTIADVDSDGDMELTNAVMLGMNGPVHHDGSAFLDLSFVSADFPEEYGADIASLVQMSSQPIWGDLTGDGIPEYITPAVSAIYLAALASRTWLDYQQPVGAWDGATGQMLEGWPRQIEDLTLLSGSAVADVSGDGNPEAIMGSAGYLVHAWDKDGNEAEGWPKFTGNWMIATPAVGDIDGDGYVDVVISTREGWLFAWSTEGRADQKIEWASLFHDAQNTGNYSTVLPSQAGPVDEAETIKESGCCKDKSTDSAWLILPLLLLGYRRRQ